MSSATPAVQEGALPQKSGQVTDKAALHPTRQRELAALVYTVFIAGVCSIVYELLIASTAAYFLGDSVKYFSLTIGLYMAAMGAGSYVSKLIRRRLLTSFIGAELLLGLLGGLAVPLLYTAYSHTDAFLWVYAVLTLGVGFLIGLEIPFLTRLLEEYAELRVNIAHTLSLDYLGALVATLAFPFLLLPWLGSFRTSLVFGAINLSIAVLLLRFFRERLERPWGTWLHLGTWAAGVLLAAGLLLSGPLLSAWERAAYEDRVVFAAQTPYQHIVLTRHRDDLRLFLDGNLQFSSLDEHRYHEALIHVPMALAPPVRRVLLLGAGDGLAMRELLRYPRLEQITLVDLDPEVVELARTNPYLRALNRDSLSKDPRVRVLHDDALSFLQSRQELFDLIVADLPDPNNTALARLYTREFFTAVRDSLSPNGVLVTQAASPFYTREAFWCIAATVASAGFAEVRPYHAPIPSFGDWGFVLAAKGPLKSPDETAIEVTTRYLDQATLARLFGFEKDLAATPVAVNTLDRPVLLDYYLDGWRQWGR